MKKSLIAGLILIFSGCSNQETEALRKANQELAAEKIKLESELAAVKIELAKLKTDNQQMSSEKIIDAIKINMHAIQIMLETYAVDHEGLYPTDLKSLHTQATAPKLPYFRKIVNPANSKIWDKEDNTDGVDVVELGAVPNKCKSGVVYISLKPDRMGYEISGCADNDEPILEKWGKKYTLVNA